MKKRGVGYSAIFYGTGYGNGFPDESRATAEIDPEGVITIYVGAAEVGQGGISTMWQIAVETLGVNKEEVIIKNNDTSLMQDSGTAAASRQTYNTGNAVLDSCKKLRENLELARKLNNQSWALPTTTNENSHVACKAANNLAPKTGGHGGSRPESNTEKNVLSLQDIYNIMINNNIPTRTEGYFKATTSQVNLETGNGNPYWPYTFGAQRVVVEVDDETGKVDVLEVAAVNDAGKVINPVLAEGQAQGGCAMGIGYAIMEEIELDNGNIKNKNYSDYIIPTSLDVPKIDTYFVEAEEESGPYGAKGIGEAVMIPTAPAIINAIYDAVGVRIYDLPATCDKVLLAIKNKK